MRYPSLGCQEKTQQVANTLDQHVVNTIEVERPKIIKQTGQKPIIQEKIDQVTKHVEGPQVQFPMVQAVQKTIEIPQLQCLSRVADMPVVVQRQVFMVQKAVEVPQVQFPNKVDEMPVGGAETDPHGSRLFRRPWRLHSRSVLTR